MQTSPVVDVQSAKAARGVRLVVPASVASPWSEGAKNVFRIAGVPTQWVHVRGRPDEATVAWTRAHNVPVVMHDDDPPRTNWSEIVTLAARLATRPIVPEGAAERAHTFGLLHELAGEDGLAWSGRLWMIHLGLTTEGARGFSVPVSQYLVPKYGYAADRIARAKQRVKDVLALFTRELGDRDYFGGEQPDALDAYLPAFLAPIVGLSESDCPAMRPELRVAFSSIKDEPDVVVSDALRAHRTRMYAQHLPFPIAL